MRFPFGVVMFMIPPFIAHIVYTCSVTVVCAHLCVCVCWYMCMYDVWICAILETIVSHTVL